MFVVMFEVQPKKERWDDYLDLARFLRPKLEAIDGFIDNERFASTVTEGQLLSLSTWRDEKAVIRWRTHGEHHGVQEKGRFEIFEDYHLRVGEVTADTAPPSGLTVTEQRFDETAIGTAKAVTITEYWPAEGEAAQNLAAGGDGLVAQEVFESITNAGKLLLLAGWRTAEAVAAWRPQAPAKARAWRHRRIRVIRDYGLRDRLEAPQFYAAVGSAAAR